MACPIRAHPGARGAMETMVANRISAAQGYSLDARVYCIFPALFAALGVPSIVLGLASLRATPGTEDSAFVTDASGTAVASPTQSETEGLCDQEGLVLFGLGVVWVFVAMASAAFYVAATRGEARMWTYRAHFLVGVLEVAAFITSLTLAGRELV